MFKTLFNFLFGKKEDVALEETVVAVAETPVVETQQKKLPSFEELNSMSKVALEALGREFGVELDRRKTKKNMINDLQTGVSA